MRRLGFSPGWPFFVTADAAITMRYDDAFLGAGLTPVELQSFSVQ